MCMNCGCGKPDDNHGHPENLIADDLRRAGDVNGQSLRDTAKHIAEAVAQLERAGPKTAATPGSGLAEPAGAEGARGGARGTPESES
jgi:hypothetical protein